MKSRTLQALVLSMLMLALLSCASYNKGAASYSQYLQAENYTEAHHSIDNNKAYQKNRNTLLYNLEKGKLYRLQNDYVNSNKYLNAADAIIESNFKNLQDVVVSNMVNPMQEYYSTEGYENFMMHYYKALNYASLGLIEDAVVEARRITLSNNAQYNKFTHKDKRYSQDAFALNLQGMIYEMAGEMNNAFIAYRNAVELYKKNNENYYDVKIPEQLKQDLLRASIATGISTNLVCDDNISSSNNDSTLILFIDEGYAPTKKQNDFIFTSVGNTLGSFYYTDTRGYNNNFDFNYASYGITSSNITSFRSMHIAMPTYELNSFTPKDISVKNNENIFYPQLAQNINSLAVNTLQERFLQEAGKALARQITKKIVQRGASALAENIAKATSKENDSDSTAEQKEKRKEKQNNKAEAIGMAAGFALNLLNNATEKADTRNWQSLPAYIHYVRIPLHAGENKIVVNTGVVEKTITIEGKKGIQMVGITIN